MKKKKSLIIFGSALIGVALLLLVYFLLILTGVIHSRVDTLVIRSGSAEKLYDGEELTCPEWQITFGELRRGHHLSVEFTGAQRDIGASDNLYSVMITDRNGSNVTDEYDLTCEYGRLSVYAWAISFRSGSAKKVYDGKPLSSRQWTISDGSLREGDTLTIDMPASQTECGTCDNIIQPTICDAEGNNVTSSYKITYETGVLEVIRRPLTLASASYEKTYDGKPLAGDECYIQSGQLQSGDWIKLSCVGQRTEAGTSDNVIEYSIVNSLGQDMSDHYDVTLAPGQLTVRPREIVVTSDSAQKTYDGIALKKNSAVLTYGKLVSGQKLGYTCYGSQINVGSSENLFSCGVADADGRDVSGNYSITLCCGLLTVLPDGTGRGEQTAEEAGLWLLSSRAGTIYLRGQSYGDYSPEADRWGTAKPYNRGVTNPLFLAARAAVGAGAAAYDIDVVNTGTDKYLPWYCAAPDGMELDDVTLRFTAGAGRVRVLGSDALDLHSALPAVPAADKLFEAEYSAFVREEYLGVPDELVTALKALAGEYGIRSGSRTLTSDIAEAAAQIARDYLRSAQVYTRDQNPLLSILTQTGPDSGTESDRLTTVTVLLYRSMGIPARRVTGLKVEAKADEWFRPDTAESAYVWLEVYVSGTGWVMLDPLAEESGDDPVDPPVDPGRNPGQGVDTSTVRMSPNTGSDAQSGSAGQYAASVVSSISGRTYLRQTSYAYYDPANSSWIKGEHYSAKFVTLYPTYYPASILEKNGLGTDFTVTVRSLTGRYLVPYFLRPGELGVTDDVDFPACGHTPVTFTGISVDDPAGIRYRLIRDDTYTAFVRSQYLTVPASTREAISAFLADQNLTVTSPQTLVRRIPEILSAQMKYGDTEYPDGVDQVSYFLSTARLGICQQFAAAGTLIFRSLGIPARYTTGYVFDAEAGQEYKVTSADAHAWVEIYLEGFGWIPVEVTAAAEEQQSPILRIKPKDVTVTYDGKAHTAPDGYEIVSGSLPAGTTLTVRVTGEGTAIGKYESRIDSYVVTDADGVNITNSFELETKPGSIRIDPIPLKIKPADQYAVASGQLLSADNAWEAVPGSGQLLEGHVLSVVCSGNIGQIGTAQSYISSWQITDLNGKDVGAFYNVTLQPGFLRLYRGFLALKTDGAAKVYDGGELSASGWSWLTRTLPGGITTGLRSGDSEEVTFSATRTEVGMSINRPTVRVLAADGSDVTDQYWVCGELCEYGSLTVSPATVTVVTDSKTAQGEDTVLVCHSGHVEGLPENYTCVITYSGTQMGIGRSDNTATGVIILDEYGRDVTAGFSVLYQFGTLTVTP